MENFHVDLAEVVAVVTGASRGAGRAVATVLGEAGATVYVTGRSVRGASSAPGREGTLGETADAVEQRGGTAVPVRCDHTIAEEVESLFERVRHEQGRLDVLVNNAWGGYEQRADEPEVPSSRRLSGSSRSGVGRRCSKLVSARTSSPAERRRRC